MQVQVTLTIDSEHLSKLEAFLESIENGGKTSPEFASKQKPKEAIEEKQAAPQPVETVEKSTEEIVEEFAEALDEFEQEKPEETPEEKPGQTFTHEDARARAYEALQAGKGALVKQALASVGAKKVPDIEPDKLGAFMGALTW